MEAATLRPVRTTALAAVLREHGLDAFLATSPITMSYLHGYGEDAHERFLTLAIHSSGEVRLICPALSETQAKRSGVADVRGWKDGEDPMGLFSELASDWNLRTAIVAVDDTMPAQMLLKCQAALPAALFKPGQEPLSQLMRRKQPSEIAALRQAGRIADEALADGIAAIKPGATELEVESAINAAMKRLGGKPTFAIVAAGANAAEPHHLSDPTQIREGDVVLMDYGCEVDGYLSDITRVVCCAGPSPKAQEVYEVVFQAHQAARAGIRPGVTSGEIDALARKVIERAGYGEFFFHRTGHGIGMRGHEEPYIIAGDETRLERGNAFSVEPGIYLPGEFGVRIENIVVVTSDGHDSMNGEPSASLVVV